MRILFLDQFSHFGGAQLCLRDVLLEARRRGWEAEVLAPGNGPLLDFARDNGFGAHSLPVAQYSTSREAALDAPQFGMDLMRSAAAVRRTLRRQPADLIYVNGPRLLPIAIQRHTPVIFHAHSVATTQFAQSVVNWSLRRMRATVLTCSQFAARPIETSVGRGAVHVIYNGVVDCGFRLHQRQGPVRVGLLGRISPEKGHLDFLEAARQLKDDANIQFSVIGSALFSDRDYERRIHSLCLDYGVELRAWTDDAADGLHHLDILAVPSGPNEASTRVVMEAFSAGTCVVAYPSGGIPELVRSGFSGLLTSRRDPAELARAIHTLANDPEVRTRLTENGRKEWETRFTVEQFQRAVGDQIAALHLRQSARSRPLASSEFRYAPQAAESGRDAAPAWRETPLP